MRLRARTDENQREIVAALRKAGRSVVTLHQVGKGVPDLLVGYRGQNFLLEIKVPGGDLTDDQIEFEQTWRGDVIVARSPAEAIEATQAVVF